MSDIAEYYGVKRHVGFALGVEFELEAIGHYNSAWLAQNSIHVETDGSLRNNGHEFITAPDNIPHLVAIHKKIFEGTMVEFTGDDPVSPRTSTHVHVNVSDLSTNQVLNMVKLYVLLEPLFFEMVPKARADGIFCVPLYHTHLPKYYAYKGLENWVEHWHKYTAFNLLPLANIGTIEFRHFPGTKDTAYFAKWLETLQRWYITGKELKKFDFDTLEQVELLAKQVFVSPTNILEKTLGPKTDLMLSMLEPNERWK